MVSMAGTCKYGGSLIRRNNAIELLQSLRNQWLTADYAAKRRILEIVFFELLARRRNSLP